MKLSQYAKKQGVTYRTAFRWWQAGQIKGYQLPSGTIVVTEGEQEPPKVERERRVALYARVSSQEAAARPQTTSRALIRLLCGQRVPD